MRCFVCSDIHMSIRKLERLVVQAGEPIDAVLFAGDLTNLGSRADAVTVLSYFGDVPVYTIPGNMDGAPVMEIFEEQTNRVHGAVATLGEWTVVGFGGGHLQNAGETLFSETQITQGLQAVLRNVESSQTILLTHQPPHGTALDSVGHGKCVGSLAVRRAIEQFQPAYHFCGHIHESWNEDTIGVSRCFNVAAVVEGRAAILDLASGTFERVILSAAKDL
jgi:uncharacterized protein